MNHKTTAYSCSMIVNHVGLCVCDLQASLRFYEGLGLKVSASNTTGHETCSRLTR